MIWLVRIGILAALLTAAYFVGRCDNDPFNPDQPPEIIEEEDITDNLDFDPEIPLLERPIRRQADVRRAGRAPAVAREDVEAFVAAAKDTTKAPRFPEIRGEYRDERLTLSVPMSDGSLVRKEWECPPPCRFGSQDTVLFAHTDRALPRLLPKVLKGAAVCAGFGAAAVGVALLADYKEPALAGAAGAGVCAVAKIAF